MNAAAHAPILPILLPLAAGIVLLFAQRANLRTQRLVAGLAVVANLGVACWLLALAATGAQVAYAVGDWLAPFGIHLLLDRLAAWMLLVTALAALAAYLHSLAGVDREGPWFHALFQFQLLGIQGAFLTADLFNLFVYFEILLIASYALLLHGPDGARLRAGLHVVVLNLVGSALFLVAVACIYAATGTLSLADLAVKAPALTGDALGLLQVGSFLLLLVFALKAAALPLGFWLPAAYGAAPVAVAVLFAVLTKVGVYSMLRVYTLAFPCFNPGPCGPSGLVLPLGLATLAFGALGALAAHRLRALSGHLVLVSLGTLLVAVGTFREAGHAAAVYYLAHSTFAGAASFVVADLIARQRPHSGDRLDRAEPVRQSVLLAALYGASALALIGLPPFAGFVGKLAILAATGADALRVWTLLLGGTLVAIVVGARAASALFWRVGTQPSSEATAPVPAVAAALLLIALTVALTAAAGPAFDYAYATARQLVARQGYVDAVYATRPNSAAPAPPPHGPLPPVAPPRHSLGADPGALP